MSTTKSRIHYWLAGLLLGLFVAGGTHFVLAWTAPGTNPPNGNVSGPITTSNTDQEKGGSFAVTGFGKDITAPEFCLSNASPSCITSWPSGGGSESDTLQTVTERGNSTDRPIQVTDSAVVVSSGRHAGMQVRATPGTGNIAFLDLETDMGKNGGVNDASRIQYMDRELLIYGLALDRIKFNVNELCLRDSCITNWPSGGGGGDNLGDHTATRLLEMDGNGINAVQRIEMYNPDSWIGYIDFKDSATEDFDVRLHQDGGGLKINNANANPHLTVGNFGSIYNVFSDSGGGIRANDVWANGSMRTNVLCLGGAPGTSDDQGDCRSAWPSSGGVPNLQQVIDEGNTTNKDIVVSGNGWKSLQLRGGDASYIDFESPTTDWDARLEYRHDLKRFAILGRDTLEHIFLRADKIEFGGDTQVNEWPNDNDDIATKQYVDQKTGCRQITTRCAQGNDTCRASCNADEIVMGGGYASHCGENVDHNKSEDIRTWMVVDKTGAWCQRNADWYVTATCCRL